MMVQRGRLFLNAFDSLTVELLELNCGFELIID
jgi:hypothetical protein